MAYSQETQELTIASWNINGKGPSSERQKVLNHYLEKIKKKEDKFTPDIIFLQEVPWVEDGSVTGPMLKGTCYSYTADSWVKEEGGPYNAVLHNKTRLIAYNGGQIPIESYRKLDEKREKAKTVHDKYNTDKKLQEAAKTNEEITHVLTEFKDRASIAYFNDCFKRSIVDHNVQRAEVMLKGRVAIGFFQISCSQAKPMIIAVSFHNRRPQKEPDKLLYLLLHFLKELHDRTGYPILLAGDFNMDITKPVKQSSLRRLIALFKPQKYTATAHRGYLPCIDNIVLWDDRGTFRLGHIQAHLVDVPFACKDKNKTRDDVSNHDPLTTTLRMTKKEVKREPEDTCTMTTRPHPPTHLSIPIPPPPTKTFSVFSWNIQGTKYAVKYELTALKNSLKLEHDLIFLQEATEGLLDRFLGERESLMYYYYKGSKRATTDGHDNVIMYNKTKFEYDQTASNEIYIKAAWKQLKLKLKCIAAFGNQETFLTTVKKLQKGEENMKGKIQKLADRIMLDANFRQELQYLLLHYRPCDLKNLYTQFAYTILRTKQPRRRSIIAVSLRITEDHPQGMLTVILYLLKELRQCLPQPQAIPILLAGDFNMDLCHWMPYSPQLYYEQTERRKKMRQPRDDYIMLWDDSGGTWTLGTVRPYPIDIEPFRATKRGNRDERIYPELERNRDNTIRSIVSLHDPLTTELKLWQ